MLGTVLHTSASSSMKAHKLLDDLLQIVEPKSGKAAAMKKIARELRATITLQQNELESQCPKGKKNPSTLKECPKTVKEKYKSAVTRMKNITKGSPREGSPRARLKQPKQSHGHVSEATNMESQTSSIEEPEHLEFSHIQERTLSEESEAEILDDLAYPPLLGYAEDATTSAVSQKSRRSFEPQLSEAARKRHETSNAVKAGHVPQIREMGRNMRSLLNPVQIKKQISSKRYDSEGFVLRPKTKKRKHNPRDHSQRPGSASSLQRPGSASILQRPGSASILVSPVKKRSKSITKGSPREGSHQARLKQPKQSHGHVSEATNMESQTSSIEEPEHLEFSHIQERTLSEESEAEILDDLAYPPLLGYAEDATTSAVSQKSRRSFEPQLSEAARKRHETSNAVKAGHVPQIREMGRNMRSLLNPVQIKKQISSKRYDSEGFVLRPKTKKRKQHPRDHSQRPGSASILQRPGSASILLSPVKKRPKEQIVESPEKCDEAAPIWVSRLTHTILDVKYHSIRLCVTHSLLNVTCTQEEPMKVTAMVNLARQERREDDFRIHLPDENKWFPLRSVSAPHD